MTDLYQRVTDTILARLQSGVLPWLKPWGDAGQPTNLHTGKAYRGCNVWLLGGTDYASPFWLTFRQARERGGTVRKGEHGSAVYFWQFGRKGDGADETNESLTHAVNRARTCPLLKCYTVFNALQCDGLAVPTPPPFVPIATAEEITAGMPDPPEIKFSHIGACYAPARDLVQIAPRASFLAPARYYATLWHELAHSTGHEKRLARKNIQSIQPFGSAEYSREELVAEIAASFLCAQAGIANETIDSSASYLDGWLQFLSDDPRAFLIAAGQAQRAAEWICPALTELDGPRLQA